MKTKMLTLTILLWTARIWALMSVSFILYMIAGHLYGVEEAISVNNIGNRDLLLMILFPGTTLVGLALAWKWEAVGGSIALLGIVITYFVRPELMGSPWINALVAPAALFIIYRLLAVKKA